MEFYVVADYSLTTEGGGFIPSSCVDAVLVRGDFDRPPQLPSKFAIFCGLNSYEKCVEMAVAYVKAVARKRPLLVLERCVDGIEATCVEGKRFKC